MPVDQSAFDSAASDNSSDVTEARFALSKSFSRYRADIMRHYVKRLASVAGSPQSHYNPPPPTARRWTLIWGTRFVNKDKTRQLLINNAIEIMKERNSIHFSVRDVTDRAGVNSSLVRYHFGSKEGLEILAFETSVASSLVRIADICGSSDSPVEKLSSYIELVIEYSKENPYAHQLLTSVIGDLCPEHSQRIFSNSLEFMIDSLSDIMDEGVLSGDFIRVDCRLLYFSLCGACVNLFASTPLHKHVFGSDEISEQILANHTQQLKCMLLRGLTA